LAILDAGCVATVGFSVDGQPYVIPGIYGRSGDTILPARQRGEPVLRTLSDAFR